MYLPQSAQQPNAENRFGPSIYVLGWLMLVLSHILHDLPELYGDERLVCIFHKALHALRFLNLFFVL